MSDPYLINTDMDLHFRDARHAKQLFSAHGHAFSPKTKFLYHVAFRASNEVAAVRLNNSSKFQKEIAVLVKSSELPRFRATIDTKQQYNRKKHIQTRVDYEDITIRLHDDNLGVTRALLEEYYRFYVKDGDHPPNSYAFGTRDKYINSLAVPNYGLNSGRQGPFFDYIKIYQLSRQRWFSYTLINPLLTSWQHDSVDASDGAGMMENSITVAYEAVVYDHGNIDDANEPVGFGSQETRYDHTPSPLQRNEAYISTVDPELNDTSSVFSEVNIARARNIREQVSDAVSAARGFLGNPLGSVSFPRLGGSPQSTEVDRVTIIEDDELADELRDNSRARQSFMAQALNSGEVSGSYEDYIASAPDERAAIEEQAYNRLEDSLKMKTFARDALAR